MCCLWVVLAILIQLVLVSGIVVEFEGNHSRSMVYRHQTGSFGPGAQTYSTGLASLALADPLNACSSNNDSEQYQGSIVLALRGDCTFIEKVLNIQKAGGIGAVIGNSALDPNHFVIMSESDNGSPGTNISIPSVFILYATFSELYFEHAQGRRVYVALNATGEDKFVTMDTSSLWLLELGFIALPLAILVFALYAQIERVCLSRIRSRVRQIHLFRSIPRIEYTPELNSDRDHPEYLHNSGCSICLDEFFDGELLSRLPCGHGFHGACIEPWLSNRSELCPICKRSFIDTRNHRQGRCMLLLMRLFCIRIHEHVDEEEEMFELE